MKAREIPAIADRLSAVLVHAVALDQSVQADLAAWFEEIGWLKSKSGQAEVALVALAAARLLKKRIPSDEMGTVFFRYPLLPPGLAGLGGPDGKQEHDQGSSSTGIAANTEGNGGENRPLG